MICSYKYCKNVLTEKDDINDKTKDYYKRCITCRSKELCVHNIKKYVCEICGGKGRCEHNKIKTKCNKCSNAICVHKLFSYQCAECKAIKNSNCIHDKITSECYLCNNKNLCPHNLNPNKCLECRNGNCICTKCTNVFQQVDGETFKRCTNCRETVKKSTAKKLTTNTTETTNCCTNCHSAFGIIINAKNNKPYKTCNVCREKDDERRQQKLEKAK
jgi:hypothetical protein